MRVEIDLEKKYLFAIAASLFFVSGIFAVQAYNSNWASSPGNPAVMGHSPDEIIGGVKCASGQALTVDSSGWSCVNVGGSAGVSSLSQGSGIALTPNPITSTGTISADAGYVQRRVSVACTAGSAIRQINADGSVVCQTTSPITVYTRTASFGYNEGTAYCNTGDKLIGGGFDIYPNPCTNNYWAQKNIPVYESGPNRWGWTCGLVKVSGTCSGTCYAVCSSS